MAAQRQRSLLIIDDDRLFCKAIGSLLSDEQYHVLAAHSLKEGEEICRDQPIDVILLDQKLPDGNGIDLCNTIMEINEQTKIIFITAFPSFDNAVNALRNGAYDYLSKPLETEEVAMTINQAFRTLELENVEQIHNYRNLQDHSQHTLIGKDGGLKETYRYIQLAAHNDAPVLLTGETGTGKNAVAKTIHYHTDRPRGSFMDINCATLPENLIEAELFGHEQGAFTGAEAPRKGIFELADGGTILLDEIGELPLHLQSKLLGVLDEQKIKRLGGQSYRKISVRIIAATNIDLEKAVQQNRFRRDLFYRLSVLPIHIPPLRERRQDLVPLCKYFTGTLAQPGTIRLSEEELENLKGYHWPGNVRELKNIIERSLILQHDDEIFPSRLIRHNGHHARISPNEEEAPIITLEEMERQHIVSTLAQLHHNHTHAARALGISRSTLLRKLKRFSIDSTDA